MKLLRKAAPLAATVGHRGFTAASNILITILAGRVLDTSNFGELALLMAVSALALLFHSSIFSEPMLVYGPREYREARATYLAKLGIAQFTAALVLAAASAVAAGVLKITTLFPFAFILLLQLTLDFLDRTFFMQLRPMIPAATAVCQFIVIVVLILSGLDQDSNDITQFLWILAGSLAGANAVSLSVIACNWAGLSRGASDGWAIARHHLDFAAWSILSHLLLFLVTGFYIFMLPVLRSIEEAALFRAQAVIIGAGVQAFSALGMVAVPMLRVCTTRTTYEKVLKRFSMFIGLSGLVIWVTIGVFGHAALGWIYNDRYSLTPFGYWLAGVYPLSIGFAFLAGSALRALDCAALVARSAGLAVFLTLGPGLLLIHKFGAEGAIFAQALGAWVMTLACFHCIRDRAKNALVENG